MNNIAAARPVIDFSKLRKDAESAHVIAYKGLSLEILFMPTDTDEVPDPDDTRFSYTAQDLAGFRAGDWWLFSALVNIVDQDGKWIEDDHAAATGCIPSHKDSTQTIFALCDDVTGSYYAQYNDNHQEVTHGDPTPATS
jgi:hypothetical protein